jgi:flagellar basal-body rod modification protein FlgD
VSITPTEAVPGGRYTTPAVPTNASAATTDKDMFLKLLVAQMRYQDPMNPTDSGQFLSQTAQFTSLEKMESTSAGIQSLLVAQSTATATSLVGRTITYQDSAGAQTTGTVSQVKFSPTGPMLMVNDKPVALGDVVSMQTA